MCRSLRVIAYLLGASLLGAAEALWWPQFRGHQGAGVAGDSEFPVNFGPESNVVWRTAMPEGNSSPCIWQDRLFLTGLSNRQLLTIAVNRTDGRVQWQRVAPAERLEKVGPLGSPASATPATDGTNVYVHFGSYGLLCYDFQGLEKWRVPLPIPVTQHGAGTSPILAGHLLILNCDQDVDSHLEAYHPQNGRRVWRQNRPGFRRGFSTPLAWKIQDQELVLVAGSLRAVAYHPLTGAEEWSVQGLPNEMCATPVAGGGLLFVGGWTSGSGSRDWPSFEAVLQQLDQDQDGQVSRAEAVSGLAQQHFSYIDANKDEKITRQEWEAIGRIFTQAANAILAVRPGGKGDVSSTHVAWRITQGLPYVPSPLYFQERLYFVKNGGLLSCVNALTGAWVYREEKLGAAGDYYASLVAGRGALCAISRRGLAVVAAVGDNFRVLARNDLREPVMATPAVVDNIIYIRTLGALYAFGRSL